MKKLKLKELATLLKNKPVYLDCPIRDKLQEFGHDFCRNNMAEIKKLFQLAGKTRGQLSFCLSWGTGKYGKKFL